MKPNKKVNLLVISYCLSLTLAFTQNDQDIFNIIFSHNFENNTLGYYQESEWYKDWNYPPWANRDIPQEVLQNNDPDNGTKVLRFHFPAGGYGADKSGGQWWTDLGRKYDEVYFSYRVKFRPGFEWKSMGKAHGLLGEPVPGPGLKPEYDVGFSARICWHDLPDYRFISYYYHQDLSGSYGDIVGWSTSPDIETGRWYTLTLRVVMNTVNDDVGNNDGIIEGFIDGELVSQISNVRFRNYEHIGINLLAIATFYGGQGDEWAPSGDEWYDTDDFFVFTYKDGVDVPRGNTRSPNDRILLLPSGNIEDIKDTIPKIKVNAYGIELNDENAHFKILVNNKYIGETYVTSEQQTYSFLLDEPVNDSDTIYIVYDNNLFIEDVGNRDLIITSINVNETIYYPDNNNVVLVYDEDVLEGDDIQYGSSNVTLNSQLVFFLGEDEVVLADVYPILKPGDSGKNYPPVIEDNNYIISDNLQNGYIVGTVNATDPNIYQELSYEIIGGNLNDAFVINSSSGELSINNSSGLKSVDLFSLLIEVKDDSPDNLSDTGLITINIDTALINNPPVISNQNFSIRENDDLNSLVIQITATDPDVNQNLTYSILSGNEKGAFNLSSTSGQLTVSDETKLDFQSQTEINLNVQVQDNGEGLLKNSAIIAIDLIPDMSAFYIDPQNTNDPLENGSFDHPYDSWADISWEEGKSYMQKRGTTANESKINVLANNVTLGVYGKGDAPVIRSSATDFAIRGFEKSGIKIQNLKIIADNAISCIYFLGASCDNNLIEGCHLEGADNGVRVIDGKTITLKYNTFSNTGDAIYSYAETTKIYYNVFKENETGINISSYLSSTEIYNNVFYDNSRGVSSSYSSLTIYNNIFYLLDKGDQAINHQLDKLVSDNNIFYPEQNGFLDIDNQKYSSLYDYQESAGLDLNSFTSDPLFKDVYNNNFSVKPESPAIDGGRDVGLLMDFYGYGVPNGKRPDIGMIESPEGNIATSVDPFGIGGTDDAPLIFPNPSDGRFKITFASTNFLTSELQIKTMAGNLMYKDYISPDDIDPTTQVDISNLPNGIYLLVLAIDDKIYTQRVIKN